MQKPQRPWATIILSALALFAALFLEWEMGRAPRMAGVSLVVALPFLALGFGIDWLRFTRPPASRALFVVALTLTTLALPFFLMTPASRLIGGVIGIGFAAAALGSHIWARSAGRIVQATYVGQRGQRSVFVDAYSCWALHCDEAFSMQPGDVVAFRFRGEESQTEDGPFRTRPQFNGRVLEIAESRTTLRNKRRQRAGWITKAVTLAAGAAALELAVLAFLMVC